MKTVDPLLGTRGEVAVSARSASLSDCAEDAIVEEALRLERIFTVFDESSALRALRRTGTTAVAELRTVVSLAVEWHQRTAGAFHPALQPLIDLWDDAEAKGHVPHAHVLAETAAGLTLSHDDAVDVSSLNLNGIAKGWIVDRALDAAFDDATVTSAWLNLGGDLVHRGEQSLRVGIEDPARPYDNVAPLATIEIANEALATSGDGRRWWDIDGVRYSKVLDPRTGRPAAGISSSTVVAATAEAADVLATTCLAVPPDEALALTTAQGAECFLVCSDGAIHASSERFTRA